MTIRCLIQSKIAGAAQTTQFTAATPTIIDKFTATNVSASTVTLAVHLVPASGSAGASNKLIAPVSIEAGKAYLCGELPGHVLEIGDSISTLASAAGAIVIRASGRDSA